MIKINKKKIIGGVLALAGVAFIFNGVFIEGSRIHKQDELLKSFKTVLSDEDSGKAAAGTTGDSTDSQGDTADHTEAANVTAPEGEASAMISIPSIDLEVAMIEGIDTSKLTYAVEHFDDTANPGQKGNFAVAGHRNWVSGAFFAKLNEVKKGDKINVRTKDSAYTYTVTDSFVVNPDETWVLEKSEKPIITLVTCTVGGQQRLIVRGDLDVTTGDNKTTTAEK